MGCDIHWVIERYHPVADVWEAVLDEASETLRQIPPGKTDPEWDFSSPGEILGSRRYNWFAVLSGVRGNRGGKILGIEGLPDDASAYTMEALDYENEHGDLHSHSYVDMELLNAAIAGDMPEGVPSDPETMESIQYRVQALHDILAREGEAGPTRILRGRSFDDETEVYLPDLPKLSRHEQMKIEQLQQTFGPLRAEYIRLLVAYDN